jgi:hypothetical protein
MKDRVLIPRLAPNGETYWTDEICAKLQAFLTKPELKEIYVYVKEKDGDPDHLVLDVRNLLRKDPPGTKLDFYYFIKMSTTTAGDEEITRENFCSTVVFGRIKNDEGNVVKSALDFIEGSWTSVLSDSTSLPKCESLQRD